MVLLCALMPMLVWSYFEHFPIGNSSIILTKHVNKCNVMTE